MARTGARGAGPALVRAGSFALLLGVWDLCAARAQSLLWPRPLAVAAALVELCTQREFFQALLVSHQALALGFGAAVALGVPVGVALGASPRAWRIAGVYIDVLLITPMPALAPLLVMATGLGLATRSAVVFTFAVAVIVAAAATGVRQADPAALEMARAFGAGWRQTWWSVRLPAAAPAIAGGLRLGLARAINGMVAAELLVVAVGLGRLLLRYQGDFDAAHAYALALLVTAEGVALSALAARAEERVVRWAEESPA